MYLAMQRDTTLKQITSAQVMLLAATAIATALPTLAYGATELVCGPAETLIGARDNRPASPYRVTGTTVVHGPNGWQIDHHLANGEVKSRTTQYWLTDLSDTSHTQWTGSLVKNANLRMVGEIRRSDVTGHPIYIELLYRGGLLILNTVAECSMTVVADSPKPSFPATPVSLPPGGSRTVSAPLPSATPKGEEPESQTTVPTSSCATMTDSTKRLSCYDQAAGASAPTSNSKVEEVPAPNTASDSESDSVAAESKGIPPGVYSWAKQFEGLVHVLCEHTVVDHSPYGGSVNWLPNYRWNSMFIGKGRIMITGKDIVLKNRYNTDENVIYDCTADLKSLPKTDGVAMKNYEPKSGDGARPEDWVISPSELSAHPPWFFDQQIDLTAPDFKVQMQWGGVL